MFPSAASVTAGCLLHGQGLMTILESLSSVGLACLLPECLGYAIKTSSCIKPVWQACRIMTRRYRCLLLDTASAGQLQGAVTQSPLRLFCMHCCSCTDCTQALEGFHADWQFVSGPPTAVCCLVFAWVLRKDTYFESLSFLASA